LRVGPIPGDALPRKNFTVKFSIFDLYLSQERYDYQTPTTKVGHNKSSGKPSNATKNVNTEATEAASINWIRNELLCFVQQKCDVLAV